MGGGNEGVCEKVRVWVTHSVRFSFALTTNGLESLTS